MRSVLVLSIVCSALVPRCACAQEARARSGWAELLEPGRQEAREHVEAGLGRLLDAVGPRQTDMLDGEDWMLIEQALSRFDRARRFLADDPELAYYTAIALSRWRRPAREGGFEMRVEDALAAWHRLREIAPDFMPARVSFEIAMMNSRRGELEEATAEYESALQRGSPSTAVLMTRTYMPTQAEYDLALLFVSPALETVHGNLAENRMLLGELGEAIRHYQAARLESLTPFSAVLNQWGLALAFERSGEHEQALATARAAISADPLAFDPRFERLQWEYGAFAALHHPDVFFEPGYEIQAYHALGYEAYAGMPDRLGSRRRYLDAALRSWRRYLVEGGTSSRFGAATRPEGARLEHAIEALPAEPRSGGPAWPTRPPAPRWAPNGGPWLPLDGD